MFTHADTLGSACLKLVADCGLQAVGHLVHQFPAGASSAGGPPFQSGVTATVLLAESHLCVHTWPERNAATLDIYVCNLNADHSHKAEQVMAGLLALFKPAHVEPHTVHRGLLQEMLP